MIEKIPLRCYGDKPSTFTAKVPGGMLPVMELDGQLCTESDTIMDLLERTFNGPEVWGAACMPLRVLLLR